MDSVSTLQQNDLKFTFIPSYEVDHNVTVLIKRFDGNISDDYVHSFDDDPFLPYSGVYCQEPSNFFIVAELFSGGQSLCVSRRTRYKPTKSYSWYELIQFPFKYRDLPYDTLLVFTIYDIYSPNSLIIVGGTSIPLFGQKSRKLRRGEYRLLVWLNQRGDGLSQSKTLGNIHKTEDIGKLEKYMRKYKHDIRFEIKPKVDWLDDTILDHISKIFSEDSENQRRFFLLVEFPTFRKKKITNETMKFVHEEIMFQEKLLKEPIPPLLAVMAKPPNDIKCIWDPEIFKDNPVEMKNRKLTRSRRTELDRDLKPNVEEIRKMEEIIHQPPTKNLTDLEKELLWTYRYSLTKNKKALTKFLRCVDWTDKSEEKQAQELITEWVQIDTAEALELLSSSFQSKIVRKIAVDRLRETSDEEVLEYLLQLVQAIRYEKDPLNSDLMNFLIERSTLSQIFASCLYWYLVVATEDNEYGSMFTNVLAKFKYLNSISNPGAMEMLNRQKNYVDTLTKLQESIKSMKENRPKKITKLRQLLGQQGKFSGLNTFEPISDPLNPNIIVSGIRHETSYIFKSALQPIGLDLKIDSESFTQNYGIIIKLGDDMRQDQLIIQMINLMDKLLKKEDLDLELTPYKVLAVSNNFGFIEKVNDVKAVAEILKKYKSIRNYFRKKYKNSESEYQKDEKKIIENYVKSCAGYCVITYLLGIGDRHLDNILLTPDGHLFHIDFGYILGRDPKPFPPPFKLSKEMVVAMGDLASPEFLSFKQYCCEAFNILRKSANLILNLFSLMLDANIPDISRDKDGCLLKIQQKYQLDLSNEDAVKYFQELIHESYTSLFPVIVEQFHKLAQAFKG
ncbi:phosphatidylinositol 3-kinase catalytic subunit type 3 [Anaeramoeba ignava]|uniref:phosphatidylinositol 3-kinase n=1 Tax=Anaeramoeba ignava TaxID=1746090 RepID=A0A9Q0LGI7_ANAIG|nr:phosphatidylinositol 3-kinase catalytic subunit type 3 [Anaeramoeba ignava]